MVAGQRHLGQVQQLAKNSRIFSISAGCKIYIRAENSLYRIDRGGLLREKCRVEEIVKSEDNSSALALKETRPVSPNRYPSRARRD
jgi:hypothetical protein